MYDRIRPELSDESPDTTDSGIRARLHRLGLFGLLASFPDIADKPWLPELLPNTGSSCAALSEEASLTPKSEYEREVPLAAILEVRLRDAVKRKLPRARIVCRRSRGDAAPADGPSPLQAVGSLLDFPAGGIGGDLEMWVPVEYASSVGWA